MENYFKGIEGVNIYPIISLLVFFCFFIALTIWALRADRKHLHYMQNLPIDNDSPETKIIGETNGN
jgi:cytochrome c oxidase cbb3-type subunit 4